MYFIYVGILLSAIIINYSLEILYISLILSGVELWLKPIQDNESFNLYLFELIIVIQFIFAWLCCWSWKIEINHSQNTIIITSITLLILITINAIYVFTYDPYINYPITMVYRRLFAYQSWFILTALSIYWQITIINPALYTTNNDRKQK